MSSHLQLLEIEGAYCSPERMLWVEVLNTFIADAKNGSQADIGFIVNASIGFRRACTLAGFDYEYIQRKWIEYNAAKDIPLSPKGQANPRRLATHRRNGV